MELTLICLLVGFLFTSLNSQSENYFNNENYRHQKSSPRDFYVPIFQPNLHSNYNVFGDQNEQTHQKVHPFTIFVLNLTRNFNFWMSEVTERWIV